MKYRAYHSDYLQKASSLSWIDCLAQIPSVGSTGLGITETGFIGRGWPYMLDKITPVYALWRSYFTFTLTRFPTGHLVNSAKLRIYVDEDASETETGIELYVLDEMYGVSGELTPTDWDATGTKSSIVASTADVETDDDGNAYLDIEFGSNVLSLITATSRFALMLRLPAAKEHEEHVPTATEWLEFCSYQNSTTALKPYLEIDTRSIRERIATALETAFGEIDAFSSYQTSPVTVDRALRLLPRMNSTEFPVIFIALTPQGRDAGGLRTLRSDMEITTLLAVHNPDAVARQTEIEGLVDDVTRKVESDPTLGITGTHTVRCHFGMMAHIADTIQGLPISAAIVNFRATYHAVEAQI